MTLWALFFFAVLSASAIAAGAALMATPHLLPIPTAARFLCGVVCAPQLIGLLVLALFFIFPGIPWWMLHGLLALTAVAALWFARVPTRMEFHNFLILLSRQRKLSLQGLAMAALLLLIFFTGTLLVTNMKSPLIAFDALQYSREATRLGAHRDMDAWVGHTGVADGTFRGDIHHPIFVGYLAWAQQFAPTDPEKEDSALRCAFQATFLAMLLAFPIIGLSLGWGWWAWAVIPLVLLVPQFDYISSSSSRDAFRIVPLIILLALLLRLGCETVRSRFPYSTMLPIALASMLALMSHTLNGFAVVSLVAGWSLWILLSKRPWLLPVVWVAVGLGLLAGGWSLVVLT